MAIDKRYLKKIEALVDGLKNASPKEAYQIIDKFDGETLWANIRKNLIKKDFTIDPYFASKIIYNVFLPETALLTADGWCIEMFSYFSEDQLNLKIIVVGYKKTRSSLENKLMEIKQKIAEMKNDPNADNDELLELKANCAALSARLGIRYNPSFAKCYRSYYSEYQKGADHLKLPANISSKLSGFIEEYPEVWVFNIGRVENASQLKKKALPVWNSTLDVLKTFE